MASRRSLHLLRTTARDLFGKRYEEMSWWYSHKRPQLARAIYRHKRLLRKTLLGDNLRSSTDQRHAHLGTKFPHGPHG